MSAAAPPGKSARNEQRKLRAVSLNAIGLAFGAFGVIQPLIRGEFTIDAVARMVICAAIAYVFHVGAVRQLAMLEE